MAPPIQNDKPKSLVYLLSGILLVLVLFEKSLTPNGNTKIPFGSKLSQDNFSLGKDWKQEIPEFKNINPKASTSLGEIPVLDEPKIENESIAVGDSQNWKDLANKEIEEFIPEDIPLLEDSSPQTNSGYANVYFIKFFGNGTKAESRLVKVPRNIPQNTDSIAYILNELKKGPREEEKSKGVLNAIPKQFSFSSNYKIMDGILHLNLSDSIEYGAGPQIIKDRLDQIAYSLIGIKGIRGIKITINGQAVSSLGGDGISLPVVLGKRDRKVISL
ncbi:MAG: GerMN domain-containing protein [Leptospiraceae bacterium]|nr:GerMN domain-containing protein [Leptospiraceae bacterium]